MTVPVAVVIPFYNGRPFLQRALDSINAQSNLPSEIVIVDDGSSPALSAHEFTSIIPLKLIAHETNRGIAAARNTGVENSEHTWVAFLDQDDEWMPRKLEFQWTAVHQKGREAPNFIYYGRAVRTDVAGHEFAWPRPSSMSRLDASPEAALQQLMLRGNLIPFVTVLFAKSAWVAAGRFDEELRGGSDDYAMLLRLSAKGFCLHGVATGSIIARRHETGFNHSDPERFLTDDLQLLGRLAADFPQARPWLRHSLGAAYYRAGRGLVKSDAIRARKYLRSSVALRRLSGRSILAVLEAYAPALGRAAIGRTWDLCRRFYFRNASTNLVP